MEKSKTKKISEVLPSLKEVQTSESIKNKLYSMTKTEKNPDHNKSSSYVDKYKAKKVLIKVEEPVKNSNLSLGIGPDPLKLRNNSQGSFAPIGKKKSKKGTHKKANKKVKFIKNEELEKKFLKHQENKIFNDELIVQSKMNEKKTDFFDESHEEFIMSIDSDDSDENAENFTENHVESYEHAIRYHIPSPRYTMLINEIEYYKHKVYLLQQENSNMHLKISILEDKLMAKSNFNPKSKVSVIHEDKKSDDNDSKEFSNDLRLKKKHNNNKKTINFVEAMPTSSVPLVLNFAKEKKNENFIEDYENFMKNLQKKINQSDNENDIENENGNINNSDNTQIEQVNIANLFKTPTNSGELKNFRKNSPLLFTSNEKIEAPERESPSIKTRFVDYNNKIMGETIKLKNSIKLPILMKNKSQLSTYSYENIQNEELEELKKKINNDLFF